eukprot:14380040-Ditylum_brightwellii.AAC.1
MERIWTETYWRIFNAHGVALEGRIGRWKKKGVGLGRGRKCVKGSGADRCWFHPDAMALAGDEVSGGGAGDEVIGGRGSRLV